MAKQFAVYIRKETVWSVEADNEQEAREIATAAAEEDEAGSWHRAECQITDVEAI